MEIGRAGIVFTGHVCIEGRLLLDAAVEHHDQAGHGQRRADGAAIVLNIGEGADVARQRDELGFVDGANDTGSGCERLRHGSCRTKYSSGENAQRERA